MHVCILHKYDKYYDKTSHAHNIQMLKTWDDVIIHRYSITLLYADDINKKCKFYIDEVQNKERQLNDIHT